MTVLAQMIETVSDTDRAAFFRTTLLLGLIPGEPVIRWADGAIGRTAAPAPVFIALSTIPAGDLTEMRLAGVRSEWRTRVTARDRCGAGARRGGTAGPRHPPALDAS